MSRSLNLLFGLLLLVIATCFGGYFGYVMAVDDGKPINRLIEIQDPRTALSNLEPFVSDGGYSGFEGLPALTGKIYRSGVVADSTINSFSVMSGESKFDVSFRESPRVFEIKSFSRR